MKKGTNGPRAERPRRERNDANGGTVGAVVTGVAVSVGNVYLVTGSLLATGIAAIATTVVGLVLGRRRR